MNIGELTESLCAVSVFRADLTGAMIVLSLTESGFATCSVSTACGSEASRNVPEPAKTYAKALRVVSIASRLRRLAGTDTSR